MVGGFAVNFEGSAHVLEKPFTIEVCDGSVYSVEKLTKKWAIMYEDSLVDLVNIIPYNQDSIDKIIADRTPDGIQYFGKWQLSLFVKHNEMTYITFGVPV